MTFNSLTWALDFDVLLIRKIWIFNLFPQDPLVLSVLAYLEVLWVSEGCRLAFLDWGVLIISSCRNYPPLYNETMSLRLLS